MKLLVWFGAFFALGWSVVAAPMIIDHTCVDRYTNLTSAEIARVKTMWASVIGASHSLGYRVGCQLLENVDSRFGVNVFDAGAPEPYTTNYLRFSRAMRDFRYNQWSYGGSEATWYSMTSSVSEVQAHISYCNTNGLALGAFCFGWSWQPSWQNVLTTTVDPEYQVRWSGSSAGGPDGNLAWGLDADDFSLTGNRVCMQTYLDATEAYRRHCRSNGYPTTVMFSTAPPIDYTSENGYQVFLKNQYIRSYVSNTTDGVLFDFADILCWNDGGNQATSRWTDYGGSLRVFPIIHGDNLRNLDGSSSETNSPDYHIGQRGALRLGKALWYALSRISEPKPDLSVAISVSANSNTILQWASQPGGLYSVLQTTNLESDDWTVLISGIAATPPMNSYTGTVNQAQSAWFRVRKD